MFPCLFFTDPQAWQPRRQHILANMRLVMGPLPERGREVPLDVQVLQTEKLPKVTRQKIMYTAGAGDRVPAYLLKITSRSSRTRG